jgi:hypothetical protein
MIPELLNYTRCYHNYICVIRYRTNYHGTGTTLIILNLKCQKIGMTFTYSQQIVSFAIPDDFEAVGACCLGMNQSIRPDKLIEPVLPPAVDGSYLDGSDRSIESCRLKIEENDVGLHVTRGHSSFRFPQKGLKFISNGNSLNFRYNILRVKTATELRITE